MDLIIFSLIMIAVIYVLFLIAPYLLIAGIIIWIIGIIAGYIRKSKGDNMHYDDQSETYTYTKQSHSSDVIDAEYTEHEDEE